ncbi:MAG: hypothetical protein IM638_04885 [Bacteroidetes bacterium]|jgi:hypothetical protein|nr:hypothetical protein [Bacteroidota bacterium]
MLHDEELEQQWQQVLTALEPQFGGDLDLQAILFIIGVQELGKGYRKFSKDQKLEVMHIAICTLLEPYGYYLFDGTDADGWPHWSPTAKLPHLKPAQQHKLMREAVVDYFRKMEMIG